MVNVLFDANIYGRIILDEISEEIIEKIKHSNLVIHNFDLIRQELRNTSKNKTVKHHKKARNALLTAYDRITTHHKLKEDKRIDNLAEAYFKEYKASGGNCGKKKIRNDFIIVACASCKGFDIIVSDDEKTMKNPKARDAYDTVNLRNNLRTPNFISYEKLKRAI